MLAENVIDGIGLVAAVVLPFFNIPLILKIVRRGSSQDISLCWALGVWVCILLMAPSGFTSEDAVWRTFNYINITMFTCVVAVTLKYRHGRREKNP
ncbi:MAG: hypothetical protein A3G91_05610 [Omnitrophica WOR_2 bacterium RIFCSPLOWO2_12_FULL_50_9]|nr:MAG: hypothetical protein A3D87_00550 [Omnitrophica WOR_2 bacterium RIFCSPHIGHO2_02_FULL_50_17]OGX43092.1 MAG: hypothetical protein A3G91_05610 [Omnitrophica WOR_2 bacterium RIFCSPLOWO2_12_FULL_50_9]